MIFSMKFSGKAGLENGNCMAEMNGWNIKNKTKESFFVEFPKAILGWYALPQNGRALFVSGGAPEGEVLSEVLADEGLQVDIKTLEEVEKSCSPEWKYDTVVGFGIIERSPDPVLMLKKLFDYLSDKGHMLIAVDNRIGIRYFCGDKDAFTDQVFDGIDNYRVYNSGFGGKKQRAYAKAEYAEMMEAAGFMKRRFYTAVPNIENPRLLYAEDVLPKEKLEHRIYPEYRNPGTVFLEEEILYDTLIKNGLFHPMGNGYLIECTKNGSLANVEMVTSSLDRGPAYSMYTIIRRDGKVEKRPAYLEGVSRLKEFEANNQYLNEHGVKTIQGAVEDGAFVMPYVDGQDTNDFFRKLFWLDREAFEKALDRWMNLIEDSSEHVPYNKVDWENFEPWMEKRKEDDPFRDKWRKLAFGSDEDQRNIGSILARGFIDLASINCLVDRGEFVFFDQEFVLDNLPANAIKIRTIDFIYEPEMDKLCPREYYYARYHLKEHAVIWRRFADEFIRKLRNLDAQKQYLLKVTRNGQTAAINRNRINFPGKEYNSVIGDIFADLSGKKLYVFGSGNYAGSFFSRYGAYLHIERILDNDRQKHGKQLHGITICGMDALKVEDPARTKVFICMKFYQEVMQDLKKIGFTDVGVFNPDAIYPTAPGREHMESVRNEQKETSVQGKEPEAQISFDAKGERSKKYKVGYISGVFDLFHIGHVNLFRRAKELCEYLIVGVVTDEQVMNGKRTLPHIPFEQRIEIVRACRYVDEAVRIPPEAADTQEAYMRYHFDVQFSGSDYENDPFWLSCRDWLRSKGADFVFFPYTKETSTTAIKQELKSKEENECSS